MNIVSHVIVLVMHSFVFPENPVSIAPFWQEMLAYEECSHSNGINSARNRDINTKFGEDLLNTIGNKVTISWRSCGYWFSSYEQECWLRLSFPNTVCDPVMIDFPTDRNFVANSVLKMLSKFGVDISIPG